MATRALVLLLARSPRATRPPSLREQLAPRSARGYGAPLGLQKRKKCVLVHGHRRVEADDDIEFERASRRGRKKRSLAPSQPEEVPAPAEGGREREKRRIREDFDVAAQRLQDMTNAFGARASLIPLDTNVLGIFSIYP